MHTEHMPKAKVTSVTTTTRLIKSGMLAGKQMVSGIRVELDFGAAKVTARMPFWLRSQLRVGKSFYALLDGATGDTMLRIQAGKKEISIPSVTVH